VGYLLARIFLRNEQDRRPVYEGTEKFQSDPHWCDHTLFYDISTATTEHDWARATRQDGQEWWQS
jgi:hypothetical protein